MQPLKRPHVLFSSPNETRTPKNKYLRRLSKFLRSTFQMSINLCAHTNETFDNYYSSLVAQKKNIWCLFLSGN